MENQIKTEILSELKKYFEVKDYSSAIKLLNENRGQFEPGVFNYNLGLALLQSEDPVMARVQFEKAKIHGLYSNELMHALDETTQKLQVKTLEESQTFSDQFNKITLGTPFDVYITISLSIAIVALLLHRRVDKLVTFLMILFATAPLIFYSQYVNKYNATVVLEDQVVYRGPSKMFEQIQLIPQGMKIYTGKEFDGWRYIIAPESHRGWFFTQKVEVL